MGDIAERLRAFGWDAVTVDGRDHEQLRAALRAPRGRSDRGRGARTSATTMREQAMATVVDLFERDENVAMIMADISLDFLRACR